MEMHLHNTGPRRRKWEASHAPWFFVYKAIYIYIYILTKQKAEDRRRRKEQENVIPAKRSKLPANVGNGRFNVLDTGNGNNWQQCSGLMRKEPGYRSKG